MIEKINKMITEIRNKKDYNDYTFYYDTIIQQLNWVKKSIDTEKLLDKDYIKIEDLSF